MADAQRYNDQTITEPDGDEITVVEYINQCFDEAHDAKQTRMLKNKDNRDVYLGRQDYSYKMDGQSQEFLPKVPIAVEQMTYFIKKGLVDFGQWFSVDVDNTMQGVITGHEVSAILSSFLSEMYQGNNEFIDVETIISDGSKVALLEAMMIFKIHGCMAPTRKFVAEQGDVQLGGPGPNENKPTYSKNLKIEEGSEWRLRIDLIKPDDYYPDPTGAGTYEIHDVERDLHEVIEKAEEGLYDINVVNRLVGQDYGKPIEDERQPEAANQDMVVKPRFRKRVRIKEFWGTILKPNGKVAHRNVVAAVANDKYLIRRPEPNPFWHQQSPFVKGPLIRVPWSVWHKALYDDASALNIAINELFNLMIDGALSSVWGIKQVRLDDLEDPGQVSGGIPQGTTLAIKSTVPYGQHVLDDVSEGSVPQDAMAMFQFLNSEFAQAVLTNEIKMGQIPKKEVRATEVVEASQSQAVTLDGIIGDLERNIIDKLLEKSWYTILQNADNLPANVLMGMVDRRTALIIMRASPAERFQLFAGMCKFKAYGLTATLTRAREFQKMMAIQQAISQNPWLLQAAMRRFSADKTLDSMFKMMNFNPAQIFKSQDEQAQYDLEVQRTAAASQITGGSRQGGGEPTGGASVPAEANQMVSPMTGMPPNG
jgi:hypothetical protein